MTKIRTKPIAQLVFGCYFFPLILSFLFENASHDRGKVTFALSVSAVSLSAIVLFLTVKKWEQEWRFLIFQKKNNAEEQTQGRASSAEIEAKERVIKEKDDTIFRLKEENEALKHEKLSLFKENELFTEEKRSFAKEKDELVQAKENEKLQATALLQAKEEEFQKMKETLLERELQSRIQEENIAKLNEEIANLKFEMRTILKVSRKG